MRDLHRCLTQAANRKAQGMLITLSGLDGAGKSTLIASLRTAVEERQRPVAVLLVEVADGRGWRWIRLLKLITPTPTLPVLVDAGPEQSYARKGEYSVEYLRRRWTAYQTVFPWVRAAVRLRNDDLAAAQAALRTVALERLDAA